MQENSFKPGDICGDYVISSMIGTGGVAEVYKAVHRGTNTVVALKALHRLFASNLHLRVQMLAEAELLSQINHGSVVRVDDFGIDSGVPWMAMEYLQGVTLRVLMSGAGALPIRKALYYAREIAEGAAAAHKLSAIHRDLRPENIMITRQNRVKVLDMGAAKFYGWDIKRAAKGSIFEMPRYTSPEVLRDEPLDVRSDVYSLGLLLYEMLAGQHPFTPANRRVLSKREICAMQLYIDPIPLADFSRSFPAELSAFVQRSIAKNRDERPSSMIEFAEEVRQLLNHIDFDREEPRTLRRMAVNHEPNPRAVAAAVFEHTDSGPSSAAVTLRSHDIRHNAAGEHIHALTEANSSARIPIPSLCNARVDRRVNPVFVLRRTSSAAGRAPTTQPECPPAQSGTRRKSVPQSGQQAASAPALKALLKPVA